MCIPLGAINFSELQEDFHCAPWDQNLKLGPCASLMCLCGWLSHLEVFVCTVLLPRFPTRTLLLIPVPSSRATSGVPSIGSFPEAFLSLLLVAFLPAPIEPIHFSGTIPGGQAELGPYPFAVVCFLVGSDLYIIQLLAQNLTCSRCLTEVCSGEDERKG